MLQTSPTDQRVQVVVMFMRSNLHRSITLAELAACVDLSSSRLRHLFSGIGGVGCAPAKYLLILRITRSEELLIQTCLPIKGIAMLVGWQDRSHFDRQFKKQKGMTPVQYRAVFSDSQKQNIAKMVSQLGHRIGETAISN